MQKEHPDYITVTKSMRGWFALVMTWDKNLEAYVPGPADSVNYQEKAPAVAWGRRLARGKALEFKEPTK